MVRSDVIGPIRQIHLQYVQGWFTFDEVAAGWRLDPARIGASAILVDIGTHAHHLGGYVSGLDLSSLCADVGHVVPGRKVDDYASLLLRFANGARGSMWVTNAAAGAEHGLSFKIFGETGGLEWHQEAPNRLVHRRRDGFEEIVTRRKDRLVTDSARVVTRKGVTIVESFVGRNKFPRSIAVRESGVLDLSRLISHEVGITNLPKAIQRCTGRKSDENLSASRGMISAGTVLAGSIGRFNGCINRWQRRCETNLPGIYD
jgi:Oxidoreductase family, C-terminal alpha/beta domain